MSSSSSDENETTIHNTTRSGIYTQPKAGSSKRATSTRHDVSDAEDDDNQPYARFRKDMNVDVDERITALLGSLHFEQKRDVIPSDEDDDKLREIHERISSLITQETDVHRRKRLRKALPDSNRVREQVYYLRRKPVTPPPVYYQRLNAALHSIVKESFGEEYRKVATVLGLVEALAEVLILEVHAFGIPESNSGEHRNIRKLIANALTNLTYGQIVSKRRLCSYDGFIRCVVQIIIGSPNITGVYAGLIRNLSWNADSGMSEALQPTVQALALAAVQAHTHRYDVTATLSALWNLAGHSVENKRTICETKDCLKVLASILSPDARFTSLVDSATGILKYVSQYLATNSSHLDLRSMLITRMLTLLKSASFTCVTNTLGAIAHLIAKDPHMQQMIRQDPAAVQQLNVLRNSNRDDIRKAVKEVLNTLNQPCSHRGYGDMSISVGGPGALTSEPQLQMQTSHHAYHGTASPRLLSLRATRASPGKYVPPQQQIQMVDQRSSSLPRHFAMQRGGGGFGMSSQGYNMTAEQQMMYHMQQQQQQMMLQTDDQQMMYLNQQQQQYHQLAQQQQQHQPQQIPQPPMDDDDVEIPTSTVMGTRSNSERSLGSMNPGSVMTNGGWNSTLDTAANSSRALSPVSYSELPASPTMCAQVFNLPTHQETNNTTHYSSGSANTMTRSDGATTVPMDNLITPTYATLNLTTVQDQTPMIRKTPEELDSPDDVLPGPSMEEEGEEEEGDYAIIQGQAQKVDDELLTRSIQSEKPSSTPSKNPMKVSPRLNGFFSPKESPRNARPLDGDRLLMESIMSEMPRTLTLDPDPRRTQSKNEEADRRDDVIIVSHEPSDQSKGLNKGSIHRMESLESQASSEDSYDPTRRTMDQMDPMEEYVDSSIPIDCEEEEEEEDYDYDHTDDYDDSNVTQYDEGIHDPQLTIDCSMISSGSGSSPQRNQSGGSNGPLGTSTPKGSASNLPGVRRATRVSTNGKTRLPVPKTNGSLIRDQKPAYASNRPRLPPKPTGLVGRHYPQNEENSDHHHHTETNQTTTQDDTIYVNAPIVEEAAEQEQERIYMNSLKQTNGVIGSPSRSSAIVTPYNYQKPPVTGRSNGEMHNNEKVTSNTKQMLVTTM